MLKMGISYNTQYRKKGLSYVCKLCLCAVSKDEIVRRENVWICVDCAEDMDNNMIEEDRK